MSDPGQSLPLRIVCDSREQAAFRFEGFPVEVTVGALEAGDYSLAGFTRRVAIERKELGDLIGCLSHDRKRFEAELARLRGFDAAAVVIEQPQAALRLGHYRAQMTPQAAWQSVLSFAQRYRIPFIFCQDRRDAEETTFHLLRHFYRDRWRELQALAVAPTMTLRQPEGRGPRVGMDGDNDAARRNVGPEMARHSPTGPAQETTSKKIMGPFRAGGGSHSRDECRPLPDDDLKKGMRV